MPPSSPQEEPLRPPPFINTTSVSSSSSLSLPFSSFKLLATESLKGSKGQKEKAPESISAPPLPSLPPLKTCRITAPLDRAFHMPEENEIESEGAPYKPFSFQTTANRFYVLWWRFDHGCVTCDFKLRMKENQVVISFELPKPSQRDLQKIRGLENELVNFQGERYFEWTIPIPENITLVCRPERIDKINDHPDLFGFSTSILVHEREIEL